MFSKLQYISQGETTEAQMVNIKNALNAGCDWIQLRFKDKDELSNNYFAEKVKLQCDRYYAGLIVNDFADIAKRVDADGVHVGLGDQSVNEVRAIIGLEKLIGGTANTMEHVLQRFGERCDYVGLGPYRFTETKQGLSPILGLEGYQKITDKLNEMGASIPIYAIGGIVLEDIEELMKSGIHGVALSGAITKAEDRTQFVTNIKTALYATP
jgi:thiamine-phosphate pyrophosphorylase